MDRLIFGARASKCAAALCVLGFMAVLAFATWVRPETVAVGGIALGVSFIIFAVAGLSKKSSSFDYLDASVIVLFSYLLWRSSCSDVAAYARMDMFLALLALGAWSLRPWLMGPSLSVLRKLWLGVLLLFCIGNVVASAYQLVIDSQWGLFVQRSENGQKYGSGIFSHYNYMANFCVLSMCAFLAGVFDSKLLRWWRLLSLLGAIGNFALVALSHSRGGFIACAVGWTVFVVLYLLSIGWRKNTPRVKLVYIGGFLLVVALGGLLWSSWLAETRGWFSPASQLSDNGRGEWAALAVDQFLLSPLIGDGAHSYEWRSIALWPADLYVMSGTLDYVHNEYLQLLAEYGLVGMSLFLISLSALLWFLIKTICHSSTGSSDAYWAMSAVAALLAFAAQSFFSFTAHVPALVSTLLLVIVIGFPKEPLVKGVPKKSMAMLRGGILFFCGVMMFMISARELPAFWMYTRWNDTHEVDYSGNRKQLQVDIEELQSVISTSPNFKRYEELGILAIKAYNEESCSTERQRYLELALSAFENEVELYPMAPMARVNLAKVLGWLGRNQEAIEHYEYLVTNATQREHWTNAHLHYAELCIHLGEQKWYARQSSQALFYFQKGQDLLKGVRGQRFPKKSEVQLEQRIELLKNAGFKPKKPTETL